MSENKDVKYDGPNGKMIPSNSKYKYPLTIRGIFRLIIDLFRY